MKKLLKSVAIFDRTWQIYLAKPHDPELFVNGESLQGACWCGHSKIFISDELDDAALKRTLIHEIAHAVLYMSQLEVSETFSEEQLCNFMAIYGKMVVNTADYILEETGEMK